MYLSLITLVSHPNLEKASNVTPSQMYLVSGSLLILGLIGLILPQLSTKRKLSSQGFGAFAMLLLIGAMGLIATTLVLFI